MFCCWKRDFSSAWCRIFSVSRRNVQRMLKRTVVVDKMEQHGNVGKKGRILKLEGTIAWMERCLDLIGDKMSDKNQMHLSCWKNQKDVYNQYCTDIDKRGNKEEILGISVFCKIWGESFTNVVIPEVSCYS